MRREDLTGCLFGMLTAISITESSKGETKWLCRCSCGSEKSIFTKALKRGKTVSCGCRKESHGSSDTVEYSTFRRMKERCNNPKHKDWHLYGGKGICVEFTSFSEFFSCVGKRPTSKHSIDRINSDGNYCDGNIRWATALEQANNLTCNRKITAFGKTMNLSEWGRETELTREVIEKRIDQLGWPVEKALSTPCRGRLNAMHP